MAAAFPKDTGILELYFQEVSGSTPLSNREEFKLAEEVRKGNEEARNELVAANLRFVIKVACEYLGFGVPLEDLISAGNVGLIQAAERFDSRKGFRLITYAVWWIRQAISQALTQDSRMVRLPANRTKLLSSIQGVSERLGQDREADPEPEMIAEALGVSEELVRDTMIQAMDVCSIDRAAEEDQQDLASVLSDPDQEAPDAKLEENSDLEQMEAVLDSLEERESQVLRLHFGLGSGDPMTLEAIGSRFNLTKERVRQIKEKALSKLRDPKRRMRLDPLVGLA